MLNHLENKHNANSNMAHLSLKLKRKSLGNEKSKEPDTIIQTDNLSAKTHNKLFAEKNRTFIYPTEFRNP